MIKKNSKINKIMAKTETKPAVKATVKTEVKTETKKPVVKKAPVIKKSQLNMSIELKKIADAYTKAINGKIKFSEVKEMFKKLHKEVKKNTK